MFALLLAIGLAGFFTVLGYAATSWFLADFRKELQWLLAPVTGVALTVLIITELSQIGSKGIPVGLFARPLAMGLGCFIVARFYFDRPRLIGGEVIKWSTAVLLCLGACAWPMLMYGFDWISYGNDDMANCCLGAARFASSGFYGPPTNAQLAGNDYSAYYWFVFGPGFARPGSELMLAWVSSLTGLTPLKAYMPTIAALAVVQVIGAASLFSLNQPPGSARSWQTAVALSVLPLFALGVFTQLIAQVAGVAVFLGTNASLALIVFHEGNRAPVKLTMLAGLLSAALCVIYPEITPFAGLSVVVLFFARLRKNFAGLKCLVRLLAAAALCLLVLRSNALSYAATLLEQVISASDPFQRAGERFPYFVVPSGLPTFLGLTAFAETGAEPWLSIKIGISIVVMATVAVLLVRETRKAHAWAAMALAMSVMAIYLALHHNQFGLFKLAMFAQPALASVVVCALALVSGLWLRRGLAIAALAAIAVPLAIHGRRSLSFPGNAHSTLPLASKLGMGIPGKPVSPASVFVATTGVVESKLAALHLAGAHSDFAQFYFDQITGLALKSGIPAALQRFHPRFSEPVILDRAYFVYDDLIERPVLWGSTFTQTVKKKPFVPADYLMLPHPSESVVNRSLIDPNQSWPGFFRLEPMNEAANLLVFTHSSRGQHYYAGTPGNISLFQCEPDTFLPGQTFSAVGSFMLFEVLRPSPKVWLRFAYSRTIYTTTHSQLPTKAVLHAAGDTAIPFLGKGAANVIVGPIAPLEFAGRYYVAVDLNIPPEHFPEGRTGLMNLFGSKVRLDNRETTGFARDLSLLTAEQLGQLTNAVPKTLAKFPQGLLENPGLEYSGLYEDGWASDEWTIKMPAGKWITISGDLPGVDKFVRDGVRVGVTVNQSNAQPFVILPGKFRIAMRIADPDNLPLKVHVSVDDTITLPAPDGRRVSLLIKSISVENP